jgi:hypothetical protein
VAETIQFTVPKAGTRRKSPSFLTVTLWISRVDKSAIISAWHSEINNGLIVSSNSLLISYPFSPVFEFRGMDNFGPRNHSPRYAWRDPPEATPDFRRVIPQKFIWLTVLCISAHRLHISSRDKMFSRRTSWQFLGPCQSREKFLSAFPICGDEKIGINLCRIIVKDCEKGDHLNDLRDS